MTLECGAHPALALRDMSSPPPEGTPVSHACVLVHLSCLPVHASPKGVRLVCVLVQLQCVSPTVSLVGKGVVCLSVHMSVEGWGALLTDMITLV